MLTTARVDIPGTVSARLKQTASYSDNVNDYAREDLLGFRRPVAAAFALLAPLTLAFIHYSGGLVMTAQVATIIAGLVGCGLVVIGREEWPNIVAKFQSCVSMKRKAIADLRCGFGEASFLSNGRAPRVFSYDHGVLIFADAGDFKTLFFDIANDGTDPRWETYQRGEMNHRVWRWLRLPVSREIVQFSTEGSRLVPCDTPQHIRSIEAWEAINLALGEPLDGAIIHQPFDEMVEGVERLL
ncbi:hypothetical protein [Hyphococcus lacteus]|uniref:Uncharacterized protein n=1 Tax=Hyphococcus lacteus TaxID=3143536 RepID=A0ABV3Z4U9_9PROT